MIGDTFETHRSAVALDPRVRGGDERSTSSRAIRVAGAKAFAEAGITLNEVDHLIIYDTPCSLSGASLAHLPIYGLEDRGFVPREVGGFIAGGNTAAVGKPPFTNGGAALRHVRHVRAAGERAPDARHRPRPNPRCPDLGLPRRRRHVRRKRHHHHVE